MRMLVVLMLMLATSCAVQQSLPGVIGRWEVTETSEPGRVVTTLSLSPDRTCELHSRFLDLDETQSGTGTFSVVGNELRLDLGESGTTSFQIVGVTDDTLTVKKDYELTFTRQREPQPESGHVRK